MKRIKLLFILTLFVSLLGCNSEDNPRPIVKVDHALFVYLGNLPNYVMEANIDGMIKGLTTSKVNGKVVIFYDEYGENTKFIELRINSRGKYDEFVLKDYGENLNTSDLNVFKLAISDLVKFAPSDGYSLIMSSHGSGWVTSEMMSKERPRSAALELSYTYNPLTRAIVDAGGYGSGMDVHDVADALPDGMFDFVMFDACNMGCIEVVYAFKDKVDFVLASLSEVLIAGFPYATIIENLFDKSSVERALVQTCEEFFNFYKDDEVGCNIALYDCSKLEAVATSFSAVVDRAFDNNIVPVASGLQWFDGPIYPHIMYDMLEFAGVWVRGSDDLLSSLAMSLEEMIVYGNTTDSSVSGANFFRSPVSAFCGVSIYIPQRFEYTNRYYMTTDWYRRVYGAHDISTMF